MTFAPCETANTPALRAFLALWNMRRASRAMPERREIGPRDMKDYLCDVHLYEVVDGGRDFRIRLVGTGFSEAAGYDPTGEMLSTVGYTPVRERMFCCAARVVQTAAPVYAHTAHGATPKVHHRRVEALMVPLGNDDAITHVLGHVVLTNGMKN